MFTSRRGRGRAGVVLVALLSLSVSACGNDGGGDSSTGDVPLALVYPTSGVWKTQGTNSSRGAELAIADVNAAGGVLDGRMLVGNLADAGNDPQSAASAARRLIQKDAPAALIGSYLSSYTLTVSTVAEQAKIPTITQSFSDELVTRGYKYTFKFTPTAADFSESLFDYLKGMYESQDKAIPRAVLLASDDASGQQQYEAAVASAPKAGFDLALKLQYPANITDTSSLVSRIASADPEIVLLNGPDLAEIQIVKALRARGIDVPVVGLGGAGATTQAFADDLGEGVDGVLATVPFNADISDTALDIEARYLKEYGGTFMPAEAGTEYVAVMTAAAAIEQAGSADPVKVAEALRTLKPSDGTAELFPGGDVVFDEAGLNENAFPVMVQYQDGKPTTVWPSDVAAAKPVL